MAHYWRLIEPRVFAEAAKTAVISRERLALVTYKKQRNSGLVVEQGGEKRKERIARYHRPAGGEERKIPANSQDSWEKKQSKNHGNRYLTPATKAAEKKKKKKAGSMATYGARSPWLYSFHFFSPGPA